MRRRTHHNTRVCSDLKPRCIRVLDNPHVQTILPALLSCAKGLYTRTEILPLPDGDELSLHWSGPAARGDMTRDTLIILPGMEGGLDSTCVRTMMQAAARLGKSAVVLSHRGARKPNRLQKFYHAGHIEDIAWLVQRLTALGRATTLYAVGFSLGGVILTRFLAEHCTVPIQRAATVSMPFCLDATAEVANCGINRLYQQRILASYKSVAKAKQHFPEYRRRNRFLNRVRSIRDFDRLYTAPINGFASVEEYYEASSAKRHLPNVTHPLLLFAALDDPLIPRETFPASASMRHNLTVRFSTTGGHLGFYQLREGKFWPSWLDNVIDFLWGQHSESIFSNDLATTDCEASTRLDAPECP